jgi:hypothetical protein
MNALPVWGAGWVSPENLGVAVIKVLAVAGGALVGGLLTGLTVQLLARLLTASRVPARLLRVMRLAGGVTGAVIVAVFIFGTGSGTGGGFGWFAGGGGTGPGTAREGTTTARQALTGTAPGPRTTARDRTHTLRVEVLVDRRDNRTVFRPEGTTELLSLRKVEDYVRQRREREPALDRLELVIYLNSPDRDSGPVKELRDWARRERLATSDDEPRTNAP